MLADLDNNVMQDRGPRNLAATTTRLCVATAEAKPIDRMIRFVVGPDRAVVPDIKRKLPGRGVWVTARRDILAHAISRNAFARAFKTEIAVSKDLPALVEQLLERSVLDALAVAYKAGAVIAGFAKVESAIETDDIAALLHARDASADGYRKIVAAVNRRFGKDGERVVTMSGFTSAQLHLALGRPNVVHAAVLAERPSDTVLARWRLLDHFRMDPDQQSNPKRHDSDAPKLGLE